MTTSTSAPRPFRPGGCLVPTRPMAHVIPSLAIPMLRYFRTPGLPQARIDAFASMASQIVGRPIGPVATESCFYIEEDGRPLSAPDLAIVHYLLAETFEPERFGPASFIAGGHPTILEYGPRLEFETAWSSAAVEICRRSGIGGVRRIERSVRLGLAVELPEPTAAEVLGLLYDRMTEMPYREPLTSFESGLAPKPVAEIPLLDKGVPALEEFSEAYGCGWDAADLEMISGVFRRLGRNPTDVELFQIAQANSEHSRHWVFKGELWVDGQPVPEKNLMQMVKQPLECSGPNSVIAFCDDSSAIRGKEVDLLVAIRPAGPVATREQACFPASDAHRRDPQLSFGRRSLPGRSDGYRRPHPRQPSGGERRAGVRVRRGLLRRQPAHPGLPAAVGGRRLSASVRSGLAARYPDPGQQRGLGLRQLFRRATHLRVHAQLRASSAGRVPLLVQADHVQRRGRPDPGRTHRQAQAGKGHARSAGRRTSLSDRHGRRSREQHGTGEEPPGPGFQRGPARRP